MKRMFAFAAILLFCILSGTAEAQEYDALVYLTNGEGHTCKLINMSDFRVNLRINGVFREYQTSDVGVIILNNDYTDFYRDQGNLRMAAPHMMILKNGDQINGRVKNITPGQPIIIEFQGRDLQYNPSDVARVYLNPAVLFDKYYVVSANVLNVEKPKAQQQAKKNDSNAKGSSRTKTKDKVDKNKGNNNNNQKKKATPKPQPKPQRLGGGQVLITFRNGGTTSGIIYDVSGGQPELVLRDGRRFALNSIYQINYFEVVDRYKEDNNLPRGGAVFIFRNGGSTVGQVIDYRGRDEWELSDGRMIPANTVKRIIFR
jgi:hypothetical protein